MGATGVLGRVYTKDLASRGASLVIADRPGSDVLTFEKGLPGNVKAVEIDVADEESVIRGTKRAVEILGGLDAVINNAAVTGESLVEKGDAFAPFEEYPLSAFRAVLDVNLTGTFLVAREAGRAMKEAGAGSLLLAVVAHLAMGMRWLEHLIFTFPELLLVVLAIVILLGRYSGYRFTELARFRALAGR